MTNETELDALPESMRETWHRMRYASDLTKGTVLSSTNDIEAIFHDHIHQAARVRELERENAILEIKNRGTLANNLCPDHRDKQTGKPCLACTIETLTRKKDRAEAELAAIKRRIAESATATLRITYEEDHAMGVHLRDMDIGALCWLDGECVRLLPLDDEANG